MTDAPAIAPPASRTRRVVALTLAGVLVAAAAVALVIAGALKYRSVSHKASTRQGAIEKLNLRVANLQVDLAAANTRARKQFKAGLDAGTSLDKTFHTTYADGLKAGRSEVFTGYSSAWQEGSWYFVKIGHAGSGLTLDTRVDVTPCQLMYESNDEVYNKGTAC